MPKSRNRKNHKKSVLSFKKRVEDRKKAFDKQMRALYEKQQQMAMDKQIAGGAVESQEIEGLNSDDFKLEETEIVVPTDNITQE